MNRAKFVFVTGDSGTSSLCQQITQHFRFVVIDVKEQFLQHEAGMETPVLVDSIINAMAESPGTKSFLIDGFPRQIEEAEIFEKKAGFAPEFILYFKHHGTTGEQESNGDLFQSYEARGLIRRVNATLSAEQLTGTIKTLFATFVQYELLHLSKQLLDSIDQADFATYQELCDENLTAFEAESQGQLVEGLPFHEYYFKMGQSGKYVKRVSTIAAPKVVLLSEDVALVTLTRLIQGVGTPLAGNVDAYNETRIWKRFKISPEDWKWKHVHFHRSNAPTNPLTYEPRIY